MKKIRLILTMIIIIIMLSNSCIALSINMNNINDSEDCNNITLMSNVNYDFDNQYAVILMGPTHTQPDYEEKTQGLQSMYDTLHDYYSFSDENIIVMFRKDIWDEHPSFDMSIVDEDSSMYKFEEIMHTFSQDGSNPLGDNDLLFIFWFSHGGPSGDGDSYVQAFYEEGSSYINIGDEAFADFFKDINDGLLVISISACNSGGLIDELSSENRIIFTSADAESPSFFYRFGLSEGLKGYADFHPEIGNQDGIVSIDEAYRYADIIIDSDFGLLDDNHDTVGHNHRDVGYDPNNPNKDGHLAAQIALGPLKFWAKISGPNNGQPKEEINFKGYAVGGNPTYSYHWEFDDGTTSNMQNPTHKYDLWGTYNVILTATDSSGDIASDEFEIFIQGKADLECNGNLHFEWVNKDDTLRGNFIVKNIGDPESLLSWSVNNMNLNYASVSFNPKSGIGLTPEDGEVTIKVTIHIETDIYSCNAWIETVNLDDGQDYDDDVGLYLFKLGSKLECSGSICPDKKVEPGNVIDTSFTVENTGPSNTWLNWEIESYPEWGTWTFKPDHGSNLEPSDGKITVDVEIEIPNDESEEFIGKITVVNADRANNKETIDVSIRTVKNKAYIYCLIQKIVERFLPLQQLLRNLNLPAF